MKVNRRRAAQRRPARRDEWTAGSMPMPVHGGSHPVSGDV